VEERNPTKKWIEKRKVETIYKKVSLSVMVKNSEEPRKFDAVKGGQVPPPVNGAVLGGIEGLRHLRFVI
jgi:hypothetical protein